MKECKKEILNYFIDRFEKNNYFSINKTSTPRRIYLKITKLYPNYGKSEFFEESDILDKNIDELLYLNYVCIGRHNEFGNREIILNMDKDIIDEIYVFLNRKKRQDFSNSIINEINKVNIEVGTFIYRFLEYVNDCVRNGKSVYPYMENNSFDDFKNVLRILILMNKQNEEISFRKFSILVFNSSKKMELYKKKIFNIIKDFSDEAVEDEYHAFECFNIYRNPSHIYIKGDIIIGICDQIIDLKYLDGNFVLSNKNIEKLVYKRTSVTKIITVENLTSFYDLEVDDALIIYLGGFHNSVKRKFLVNIYNFFKDSVEYYHFGDIDAGGFYIYLDLISKTNIKFKTYKMDIETLRKYQKYALELTPNDIERLSKLRNIYDNPVIDYMLDHNIKLEQEIIE